VVLLTTIMRLGLWDFIRDQWAKQKPVVTANLTAKTVIVLGANSGIGFEAAKHFASMTPGRFILACRSQS
jgi:FlaA1/EpsC-like NDP-sugar epimerase